MVLSVESLSVQKAGLGFLYGVIVTAGVYDTGLITVRLDMNVYRACKSLIDSLSKKCVFASKNLSRMLA